MLKSFLFAVVPVAAARCAVTKLEAVRTESERNKSRSEFGLRGSHTGNAQNCLPVVNSLKLHRLR